MARTLPNMSLEIWDQLADLYDHTQLANNFAKLDNHDHTSGRGVQLTTESLADGSVTNSKLAIAKPEWHAVTFKNSWKNVGGATPAAYLIDAFGFVHLRGRIESGASGSIPFELPAGFRPGLNDTYPIAVFPTGATLKPIAGAILILSTGELTVYTNGAFENIGLGGVTFLAEN